MIESFMASLADRLPFGYSFGAGMITTVSPCGIAMLPAYVSLYLGSQEKSFWSQSVYRRIARALVLSGIVTLGFAVLFGVLGIIVSSGGQSLFSAVPWASVAIGAVLILMGVYLLLGGHFYTGLPARLASRIDKGKDFSIKGFIIFGVAYGIAALSCTLPVFLVVVGSAMALKGVASGLLQFVSYALGMGFVIAIITVGSALFKETINLWLRRLVPIVARVNGLLLIIAGGYILYYWFTTGNILG